VELLLTLWKKWISVEKIVEISTFLHKYQKTAFSAVYGIKRKIKLYGLYVNFSFKNIA
jgi:hypothetical protein